MSKRTDSYMRKVTHTELGPGKRVIDHLECGHEFKGRGVAKKRRCVECIRENLVPALTEPKRETREGIWKALLSWAWRRA